MRPKSGLPKRKALRTLPEFTYGLRDNPEAKRLRDDDGGQNAPALSRVVSMFCGCGGMDLGFLGGFQSLGHYYPQLPFRVVQAYDLDGKAVDTYRLNIDDHVSQADLTKLNARDIPGSDILLGGFPCQDFSSCGPKVGFEGSRGRLYRVMVDYMKVHQPMAVVAENVPHLAKLSGGTLLQTIVSEFEQTGYSFRVWNISCPDYGLPQNRTRLFFVGVRNDVASAFGRPLCPEPKFFMRHRTIDEAIDDLILVDDESVVNQSQYFVATRATRGAGQGDQCSARGEVAYAVRANPKARVHFHYELARRLTVRECARLQSFPDQFVFPFSTSTNFMQIGNAVPPIIAHQVASEIALFISQVISKKSLTTLA